MRFATPQKLMGGQCAIHKANNPLSLSITSVQNTGHCTQEKYLMNSWAQMATISKMSRGKIFASNYCMVHKLILT